MDLTYQQVLAEVYEENSKNILVHQAEYDDEDKPGYERYDYDDNELPDKDEFNKPSGNRNKPEHIIKPKPDSGGKSDLNHKTNVRNIVLNIDGAFRGNIVPTIPPPTNCNGAVSELVLPGTLSSHFSFMANKLYKNITSVKMTSMEFNNTFYTFSTERGNTEFFITLADNIEHTITIPDGNYKDYSIFAAALQTALNNPIPSYASPAPVFVVRYDAVSHKIAISGVEFLIAFPPNETNPFGNGIGYNMGFLGSSYDIRTSVGNSLAILESDQVPDIVQDTYVYLQINDWNLVEHQIYGQTYYSVFSKIQLSAPKNTIVFDSNFINSSTKQYVFQQPVNLQRFDIRILDAYGNTLDLRGGNFSLTLELEQVNNSAVYEKLLEG